MQAHGSFKFQMIELIQGIFACSSGDIFAHRSIHRTVHDLLALKSSPISFHTAQLSVSEFSSFGTLGSRPLTQGPESAAKSRTTDSVMDLISSRLGLALHSDVVICIYFQKNMA